MSSAERWSVEAAAALASDEDLSRAIMTLEALLPEDWRPALRSLCRTCYMNGQAAAQVDLIRQVRERASTPPPRRSLWSRLRPW